MGVFAQYAGTILAADEAPAVIEGDSDRKAGRCSDIRAPG